MHRFSIIRALMFGVTLLSAFVGSSVILPTQAYAVASCSACFTKGVDVGITAGCATANADCEAGMTMIRTALTLSEKALLAATGMKPNTGLIGFPALASAISAADATTTRNIIETIDWSQGRIARALRRVPDTQNTIDIERKSGANAPRYHETSEAVVSRGVDYDIPSPSGLKAALNWRLGAGGLSTSIDMEPGELAGIGDAPDQGAIPVGGTAISQASAAAIAATLKQISESSTSSGDGQGSNSASTGDLLNGALLLSDSMMTLDHSGPSSESALADYFLQISVSDTVSPALALNAGAVGPSDLTALVDARIHDFRFNLVYGVLSKYSDMRKAKFEPSQSAAYYYEMIGEEPDAEPLSEEALLELSSTYRVKSAKWRETVAVDKLFAARELVHMEADLLNLKYRRWQIRRDINLLFSQLLAAELRDEGV